MGTAIAAPEFRELPDEVASLPPGRELSAVLAGLDPVCLTGFQLTEVVSARYRQICFEQGKLLAEVRELVYAPRTAEGWQAPIRNPDQDPYTAMELSMAMTWTDYMSATMVGVALFAVDKAPAVQAALLAGRLDLDKAKVLCAELTSVDDVDQLRELVELILFEAEYETTAQLRVRIRRLLAKVNPEAVRRRRARSVTRRYVQHVEDADGTSSLTAWYLSKERAAAAFDNIDAIARATKVAGDPLRRSMDQLRADVFADLLAGVDPTTAGAATPGPRKGVINLHVDLATLACLADEPGEIDGFGPVIADIARQNATQLAQIAQWRFTVTDRGDVLTQGVLSRSVIRRLTDGLNRHWADYHTQADHPADHSHGNDNGNDNCDACQGPAFGRGHYRPTAAQAAYVRSRDRTCRAPGCRRTAMRCEIDHNRDWDHGGPSLVENLCCLCKKHHRAKHEGGYKVRRTRHGIEWETPLGRCYTVVSDRQHLPNPLEYALSQHLEGHNPGLLRR